MSLRDRDDKRMLLLVSMVLLFACAPLLITAVAAPSWSMYSVTSAGLFQLCVFGLCEPLEEPYSELVAVRFSAVMGLLADGFAFALCIYCYCHLDMKSKKGKCIKQLWIATLTALAGGLLEAVAATIWGVKIQDHLRSDFLDYELSYAFYVCAVGSGLLIVTAFFIYQAIRKSKKIAAAKSNTSLQSSRSDRRPSAVGPRFLPDPRKPPPSIQSGVPSGPKVASQTGEQTAWPGGSQMESQMETQTGWPDGSQMAVQPKPQTNSELPLAPAPSFAALYPATNPYPYPYSQSKPEMTDDL